MKVEEAICINECAAAGMATCHCPGPDDVYDAATATHKKIVDIRYAPAGIGDVNSDAKGSGARFNGGKPDLSLIPLTMLAGFFQDCRGGGVLDPGSMEARAILALECLGLYQSVQDTTWLFEALERLGADGWEECARVFDYGKRKYAAWNWAKGMPWSVPLACAARHLLAMIAGEPIDNESQHPHRGHVFCNVVMLLQYSKTYTEGNDLPAKGLL